MPCGERLLLAGCLLTVALASPSVFAEDKPGSVVSAFDRIGDLVKMNADMQTHYGVCPADVANSARPAWKIFWDSEYWSEEACEKDLDACYRECSYEHNESACFALARNFEDQKRFVPAGFSGMLYAHSCALGYSGGCTNRAAGLLGDLLKSDPMSAMEKGELLSCTFRTFSFSCADRDPWGCTMQGFSYDVGEGVKPDANQARQSYLKSCEIAADFEACFAAKARMQQLDTEQK